jgi:hypothetical protein
MLVLLNHNKAIDSAPEPSMQNAAFATFQIIKTSPHIEAIVDVESTKGWLGACRVYAPRNGDIQTVAYNEADRRAEAHGLTLQYLRAA